MGQRLNLQAIFEAIPGVAAVYFQAPESTVMEYPCIRYEWDDEATDYADNLPYSRTRRYQVTVIDEDPDSPIPDIIGSMPKSRFDRFYTAEKLNHFVYNLYF